MTRCAQATPALLVALLASCGGAPAREAPESARVVRVTGTTAPSASPRQALASPTPDTDAPATSVRGPFDPNLVTVAIRERVGDIQTCYETRGLSRDPTLTGRVLVRFAVFPNGAVVGTTTRESSLASEEVLRCIEGVIDQIRLPTGPRGPVTFAYPFVFAPQR